MLDFGLAELQLPFEEVDFDFSSYLCLETAVIDIVVQNHKLLYQSLFPFPCVPYQVKEEYLG